MYVLVLLANRAFLTKQKSLERRTLCQSDFKLIESVSSGTLVHLFATFGTALNPTSFALEHLIHLSSSSPTYVANCCLTFVGWSSIDVVA